MEKNNAGPGDSPIRLIRGAQFHYSRSDLWLQIKLPEEDGYFFLFLGNPATAMGIGKGQDPGHLGPAFVYDLDGDRFFDQKKPNFRQVQVMVPDVFGGLK